MYLGLHIKFRVLWQVLTKFGFSQQVLRVVFQYQISRKSVQLQASLNIRTDVRRDRFDDAKRHFCVYAKVPEN
jgi:hypothetical protein